MKTSLTGPMTRGLIACLLVLGCGIEDGTEPDDDPIDDPTDDADGKADGAEPGCAAARGGDHYEFLDDVCHRKRFPSNRDRALTCPVVATTATPTLTNGTMVRYRRATDPVEFDDQALVGVVPADLKVTLILVRRVNGVAHYRYLSNGSHAEPFQPWSVTKYMTIANAAANLRSKSSYRVGLTSSVDGIPLGDLATIVHNYDETRYSSNGLSRYFLNVGGRARIDGLIHGWLGRPATETLGGNYGTPEPGLGYTFVEPGSARVTISADRSGGRANRLSTFTLAEFLKRLVMHREDAATRLPGIQWADVQTLLYGATTSRWYAGAPGGMSADSAIYLQAAVPIGQVEARSAGKWRVFSKLGFGNGQFVHAGYACLPVLDAAGAPVADQGKEMIIAVRMASGGQNDAERDARLARAYRAIMTRVVDGRLK